MHSLLSIFYIFGLIVNTCNQTKDLKIELVPKQVVRFVHQRNPSGIYINGFFKIKDHLYLVTNEKVIYKLDENYNLVNSLEVSREEQKGSLGRFSTYAFADDHKLVIQDMMSDKLDYYNEDLEYLKTTKINLLKRKKRVKQNHLVFIKRVNSGLYLADLVNNNEKIGSQSFKTKQIVMLDKSFNLKKKLFSGRTYNSKEIRNHNSLKYMESNRYKCFFTNSDRYIYIADNKVDKYCFKIFSHEGKLIKEIKRSFIKQENPEEYLHYLTGRYHPNQEENMLKSRKYQTSIRGLYLDHKSRIWVARSSKDNLLKFDIYSEDGSYLCEFNSNFDLNLYSKDNFNIKYGSGILQYLRIVDDTIIVLDEKKKLYRIFEIRGS